jgi:HEAT repeat protein
MLREEAALPEIVPLLKHPEIRMRGAAAMALGRLQAQRFAPELLVCLKDEDPGVRATACISLAELQVDSAIPALVDLLQDQPMVVRQAALGGLERLKATAAIPRVVLLLREKDLNISKPAARFLCALGSREAVPVMLQGNGMMDLSLLNQLRSPRRTKALRHQPLSVNLEGTVPDLIRRLREASPERVELPALDFSQGPGRIILLQCDGSPTFLDAWEELGRRLPEWCDVIVDEDRIRILPREQATAFWQAWHRETK